MDGLNPPTLRASFRSRRTAAEDGWKRMVAWFNYYGVA
jgi:dienelactone hydrolase